MPAESIALLFGLGIIGPFVYSLVWTLVTGKGWKKLIEREGKTKWF